MNLFVYDSSILVSIERCVDISFVDKVFLDLSILGGFRIKHTGRNLLGYRIEYPWSNNIIVRIHELSNSWFPLGREMVPVMNPKLFFTDKVVIIDRLQDT